MEQSPKPAKSYEEEIAEYTAFALGIPVEQARGLIDETPYMGAVFVEDTQELDQTEGEVN